MENIARNRNAAQSAHTDEPNNTIDDIAENHIDDKADDDTTEQNHEEEEADWNELQRIINDQDQERYGANAGNKSLVKQIRRFSDYLFDKQMDLLGHVIQAPNEDPLRQVSFDKGTLIPQLEDKKRTGGPKGRSPH